jgi:hypothetical protein
MRRPIACVLLLLTVAFQTEAVFGEVRDGDVHHEETAQAWMHAHDPHGSHAHDASDDAAATIDAGDEHEHGDSFDHCTHVHGVALVSPLDFSLVFGECAWAAAEPPAPTDARYEALSPPPRP